MGNVEKAKGRAKEVTGRLTGDERLREEGEAERSRAVFDEKVEEAGDTVRGAAERLRETLEGDDEPDDEPGDERR